MTKELLETLIETHAALVDTPELQEKIRKQIVEAVFPNTRFSDGLKDMEDKAAPLKPFPENPKIPGVNPLSPRDRVDDTYRWWEHPYSVRPQKWR